MEKKTTFDTRAARIAQDRYCAERDLPRFAPSDGRCFRCREDIYGTKGYSVEMAGKILITSCPICNRSFCD